MVMYEGYALLHHILLVYEIDTRKSFIWAYELRVKTKFKVWDRYYISSRLKKLRGSYTSNFVSTRSSTCRAVRLAKGTETLKLLQMQHTGTVELTKTL